MENPYYVDSLAPLVGPDAGRADYVMSQAERPAVLRISSPKFSRLDGAGLRVRARPA